jgi:selenide,water dikinase
VLTIDFLTPLVDDPYDFGRIAAANALSDVFAMGAKPICALNVLALDCSLGNDVAKEILRGGADAVKEAGALIVGGHSVDDPEPKYGLCVFGTTHPDKITKNEGAHAGDVLYLTKPLGVGLLSAAYKVDEITYEEFLPIINMMKELNSSGAAAALSADAHAMTDVTGFGLAGHLHEMIDASKVDVTLDWSALPLFDRSWELSCMYCRPNRTFSIMDFAEGFVDQGSFDNETFDNIMGVICDPQTSGGLLVAIDPSKCDIFEDEFKKLSGRAPAKIGRFTPREDKNASFIRLA